MKNIISFQISLKKIKQTSGGQSLITGKSLLTDQTYEIATVRKLCVTFAKSENNLDFSENNRNEHLDTYSNKKGK